MDLASDRWFYVPRAAPDAKLRLFCFPYAGGSAQVFHAWPALLAPEVEVCAVELPGRAFRMAEPAIPSMHALIEQLGPVIERHLELPYAVFGHSMGALVAFELVRWLRARGRAMPMGLLTSAFRAPHYAERNPPLHRLQGDEFWHELRRRHGAPDDASSDPELREVLYPALRADFEVIETYAYREESALGCPISSWAGERDEGVTASDVAGWGGHTQASFCLQTLPGDHFFLNSFRAPFLTQVNKALAGMAMSWGRTMFPPRNVTRLGGAEDPVLRVLMA